jgi:hypothetical protein
MAVETLDFSGLESGLLEELFGHTYEAPFGTIAIGADNDESTYAAAHPSGSTSMVLTGVDIAAGSHVILMFGIHDRSITSSAVTDSQGNAWSLLDDYAGDDADCDLYMAVYMTDDPLAVTMSGASITVAHSSTGGDRKAVMLTIPIVDPGAIEAAVLKVRHHIDDVDNTVTIGPFSPEKATSLLMIFGMGEAGNGGGAMAGFGAGPVENGGGDNTLSARLNYLKVRNLDEKTAVSASLSERAQLYIGLIIEDPTATEDSPLTVVNDSGDAKHGDYYAKVVSTEDESAEIYLEGQFPGVGGSSLRSGFWFRFSELPDYQRSIHWWLSNWETKARYLDVRLQPDGKLTVHNLQAGGASIASTATFALDPLTWYFIELKAIGQNDGYGGSYHTVQLAVDGVLRASSAEFSTSYTAQVAVYGIKHVGDPGANPVTIETWFDDMFVEFLPEDGWYGDVGVSGWIKPTSTVSAGSWTPSSGSVHQRLDDWPGGVAEPDNAEGHGVCRLGHEATASFLPADNHIVAVKHSILAQLPDISGGPGGDVQKVMEVGLRKSGSVYAKSYDVDDDMVGYERFQDCSNGAPGEGDAEWTPTLFDTYELYFYGENPSTVEWLVTVAQAAFLYCGTVGGGSGGGAGGVAIPPFGAWAVSSSFNLAESFSAQLCSWQGVSGAIPAYRSGRVRAMTLNTTTGNADYVEAEVFIDGEGTGILGNVNLAGGARVVEVADGELTFEQGQNIEIRFRRTQGALGAGVMGIIHVAYDE